MEPSPKSFLLSFIILILVFSEAACSRATPTSLFNVPDTAQPVSEVLTVQKPTGAYEPGECPFRVPSDLIAFGSKYECGFLTVPEDRSQPGGESLKLPVLQLKTGGASAKHDPMLILFSAPSSILDFAGYMVFMYDHFFADRDLIVMEQRGVGYSQPSLDCPDLLTLYTDSLTQAPYSRDVLEKTLLIHRNCRDALVQKGIHLSAYSTQASAADIEDLRLALGIDQWNIVSAGYSSNLALLLMRDAPQGIRSVIMDSPQTAYGNIYTEQAAATQEVLNLFFQGCTQDVKCNDTYPDLQSHFYRLVTQLNSKPLTIHVNDLNAGKRYDVLLDGYRLMDLTLISINYEITSFLSVLPRVITQLEKGNTQQAAEILNFAVGGFTPTSTAVNPLIYCRDQFSLATPEQIRETYRKVDPALGDYLNVNLEFTEKVCEIWKGPEPALKINPVVSAIPSLVVTGQYAWDVPAWGKQIAEGLSKSTFIEFPIGGQLISFSQNWSGCFKKISAAFVADPKAKPDTSCAQAKKSILWVTIQ
ncbi:MAG: alpha/beta fold hydrolase [Omnitrophica WOR_2 bacterium]